MSSELSITSGHAPWNNDAISRWTRAARLKELIRRYDELPPKTPEDLVQFDELRIAVAPLIRRQESPDFREQLGYLYKRLFEQLGVPGEYMGTSRDPVWKDAPHTVITVHAVVLEEGPLPKEEAPRTDCHGNLLQEGFPGLCFGECTPDNCWVYACGPKKLLQGAESS